MKRFLLLLVVVIVVCGFYLEDVADSPQEAARIMCANHDGVRGWSVYQSAVAVTCNDGYIDRRVYHEVERPK